MTNTDRLAQALRNIKNLLDGADKWTDDDVRANANCAYSVAEDALAALASLATAAVEGGVVDLAAKAIADVIGHGMREKCEGMAQAALAAAFPALTAQVAALTAQCEKWKEACLNARGELIFCESASAKSIVAEIDAIAAGNGEGV